MLRWHTVRAIPPPELTRTLRLVVNVSDPVEPRLKREESQRFMLPHEPVRSWTVSLIEMLKGQRETL